MQRTFFFFWFDSFQIKEELEGKKKGKSCCARAYEIHYKTTVKKKGGRMKDFSSSFLVLARLWRFYSCKCV